MSHEVVKRNYQPGLVHDDLLASKRFVSDYKQDKVLFYEIEAAIVLDVVIDSSHPAFPKKKIVESEWPKHVDGSPAAKDDPDYSWIGRIKFRFVNSQKGRDKETLFWASPMENTGITEFPLMNEVVTIAEYLGQYYYSRKINLRGMINANPDFSLERALGTMGENFNEYTQSPYVGPLSVTDSKGESKNFIGILGSYFKFNHLVRAIKRYEGDTILESRFGSSIRMGAYDDNRGNDNGVGQYADGGGNPRLLIRNGQAAVDPSNKDAFHHKGYVTESINNDGSSIHMTSGKTVSDFVTTCKKVLLQKGKNEEQSAYSPSGVTEFKFPTLDGDQIVINSDRLIFSSKAKESLHYSKMRLGMVTDAEFTIDAHDQVVVTTNKLMAINAPKIYLGEYGDEDEPVLLGRSTVYWLYNLCDWIINQTDLLIHQAKNWHAKHLHDEDSRGNTESPPNAGYATMMEEYASQLETMKAQLIKFRDELPTLKSKRVFTVGGGGAPGHDGGELK